MPKIPAGLRDLWAEMMRPSGADEPPYKWMVIGIAHAMLGAALSWGGLLVAAVYWWIKERGDLRRGGAWRDGLVDTGFVALGTLYAGPLWWPLAVLAAAGGAAAIRSAAWQR